VLVRIVLWNLADSKTTIEELRRYLRDESVDQFADVPGLRFKAWISDEASERWGAVYLWESAEAARQELPSRARELIGKEPEVGEEFDVERRSKAPSRSRSSRGAGSHSRAETACALGLRPEHSARGPSRYTRAYSPPCLGLGPPATRGARIGASRSPSLTGSSKRAREAAQRSRLGQLALRPEPRPKARRPPTRVVARGDEPRRTEFDLQGQHFVGRCWSELNFGRSCPSAAERPSGFGCHARHEVDWR
jgi:hypothetical protein